MEINIIIPKLQQKISKFPVICNICLYEWYPSIDGHISHKTECTLCAKNLRWAYDRFIKRAHEIHGNRYNYENILNNDHDWTQKTLLFISCNRCNQEWLCSIANHIYNRSGCPYCNLSVGESAKLQAIDVMISLLIITILNM